MVTTSPTSIDLTTATSGRRPADALVQGAGVEAGKRVASIASIAILPLHLPARRLDHRSLWSGGDEEAARRGRRLVQGLR